MTSQSAYATYLKAKADADAAQAKADALTRAAIDACNNALDNTADGYDSWLQEQTRLHYESMGDAWDTDA